MIASVTTAPRASLARCRGGLSGSPELLTVARSLVNRRNCRRSQRAVLPRDLTLRWIPRHRGWEPHRLPIAKPWQRKTAAAWEGSHVRTHRADDNSGDSNSGIRPLPAATGDGAQRSHDPSERGLCPARKRQSPGRDGASREKWPVLGQFSPYSRRLDAYLGIAPVVIGRAKPGGRGTTVTDAASGASAGAATSPSLGTAPRKCHAAVSHKRGSKIKQKAAERTLPGPGRVTGLRSPWS
jgi:hypothetical protein